MPVTLCTLGYEKAGFPAFLATLKQAGIEQILDVRDLPLSRRPGFSKRILAASLAEAGIAYVHLKPLGTPPEGREANRRKDWPRFWSIVEARLATGEAALALEQAASLAQARPSCLLCFEADPCTCHRRRVGQILAHRHGFTIQDLHNGPADG